MTKEEFRQYIMEETPVPKLTSAEAFAASKCGDMSGYDAAGKACARAIIAFAGRGPEKWVHIQQLYRDLRKFQDTDFQDVKAVQAEVIRILEQSGIDRYNKYPDWTYDNCKLYDWWDVKTAKSQLSQNIIMAAGDIFNKLADKELKDAIDKIGPSGFMWSWALNSAVSLMEV